MNYSVKKLLKRLPIEMGISSLAVILTLSERSALLLNEILGDNKSNLIKSIKNIESAKDFDDYYNILKSLKTNSAKTILWRLKQKGLISKNKFGYQLTVSGKKLADSFKEKTNELVKIKWDGKWRMVLFDIPETKKHFRMWLGSQLFNSEYKLLQKSVYIGKFPLEESLMKEIIDRNLYQYVRIITIGEIDDEAFLNL